MKVKNATLTIKINDKKPLTVKNAKFFNLKWKF